jgi:hypothetical protein
MSSCLASSVNSRTIFRSDEPFGEVGRFEFDDLDQVVLVERPEEDDVRDPVQELRLEDALRLLEHLLAHPLMSR